jgi:hypothetical protein
MIRYATLLLLTSLLALGYNKTPSAAEEKPPAGAEYQAFRNPERVAVRGYEGEVVDPFIARDGRYLFFNTSHFEPSKTALYYAERVDDLTFVFKGKIGGVNVDGVLTAVSSMDRDGNFFFISPRAHKGKFATIHRGKFKDGVVTDIRPIQGLNRPGQISFDVEISADGNTLYFVDAVMSQSKVPGAGPRSSHLAIAIRDGDTFKRLEKSAEILAKVNTAENIEYGACISADGLELFFDRFTVRDKSFGIWRAVRRRVDAPFEAPQRVSAVEGFVEAQTLSPDGRSLYYQKREGKRFEFYRVTRAAADVPVKQKTDREDREGDQVSCLSDLHLRPQSESRHPGEGTNPQPVRFPDKATLRDYIEDIKRRVEREVKDGAGRLVANASTCLKLKITKTTAPDKGGGKFCRGPCKVSTSRWYPRMWSEFLTKGGRHECGDQ